MKVVPNNIATLKKKGVFTQIWLPDGKIKAGIVLIHGLGEHSERYKKDFGGYFTKAGCLIQTFDLPGHGKSEGARGYISSTEDFFNIIDISKIFLQEKYGNVPLFLYGHSLGGLIILDYLHRGFDGFSGFISSAPVLDVFQPVAPIKIFLAKLLKNIVPAFSMPSGLEVDKLSKDVKVVEDYKKDMLVHSNTSAIMGEYIIERGTAIRSEKREISLPGLIMVGSEEEIVSKDAIMDFCSCEENTTLKIWDGLLHELHNEPEKKQVFDFTWDWMTGLI